MAHFNERLKGERAIRETIPLKRPPTWGEAQEAKRVAHGLKPESFKIQNVITDCVLVQPDPNAHLGAKEE